MAPPTPPVYWDGKSPDVGDDAWLLSADRNGHNHHLKPNLVGLDINTMQYNGMANRFASQEPYKQLIQAHGALAAVAFLFLIPIAVMMGEFCRPRVYALRERRQRQRQREQRQRRRGWLQARLDLVAVTVATAAFILAFVAVGHPRTLTNPHHIIGVALYVMLLLWFVVGGCWTRPRLRSRSRSQSESGRTLILGAWIHQWLGRLTTLLGLAQVPLGLCLYGVARGFFILYAVVAGVLVLLYFGLSYVYEGESGPERQPYVPPDISTKVIAPPDSIQGRTPEPLVHAPWVSGANTDAGQIVLTKEMSLDSVKDVRVGAPATRVNGVDGIKTLPKTSKGGVETANGGGITTAAAPASRMPEEGAKETNSNRKTDDREDNKGWEKFHPERNGAHDKALDSVNRARKSRAAYRLSAQPRDEQFEPGNRPSTSPPTSAPPAGHPEANAGPGDIKTNLTVRTVLIHRNDMKPWETRDKKPPLNTATALPDIRAPEPDAGSKQLVEEEAQISSERTETDTESQQHVSDPEDNERPISNITSITTSQAAHSQVVDPEEAHSQEASEPAKKKKRTIIRKKLIKKPAPSAAPPTNNDDNPLTVPKEPDQTAHSRLSSWDNIPEHYRLDGDETDGQSVASYLWDAGSAAHQRTFALRRHTGVSGPAATTFSYPLPGVLEVPREPGPSQSSGVKPRPISRSRSSDEVEAEDEVEADEIKKTNKTVPSQPQPRPVSITSPAAILPRPVPDAPDTTTTRPHELRRVRPATTNGFAEALAHMYRNRPRHEPEELPGFVPYLAANDDRYRRTGG